MSATTTICQMLVFECDCIYVVSGRIEGKRQHIYIGKAGRLSVAQRMTEHLTGNEKGKQKFGKLLLEYRTPLRRSEPSHRWIVEILTKEECWDDLGLTKKERTGLTLDKTKQIMIHQYKPLANT
jgi:hypothetical protein